MPFSPFDEDDPFGWQEDEVLQIAAPPVEDPAVVQKALLEALDKERKAKELQELIAEKRAAAKRVYLLKQSQKAVDQALHTAAQVDQASMPVTVDGPPRDDSAVSVKAPPSVPLPVAVGRATRVLRRHSTPQALAQPVLAAPNAKRRRIIVKSPATRPGCFEYPCPISLPVSEPSSSGSTEGGHVSTSDFAVSVDGVLADPFIAAALADVTEDVLEHKLINVMSCRCILRGAAAKHCKELILSKVKRGILAPNSEHLSTGRRIQWGASQYLNMMSPQERCRLYRTIITELREENKSEVLLAFLCHL